MPRQGAEAAIDTMKAKLLEGKKLGTDRQTETGSTIKASESQGFGLLHLISTLFLLLAAHWYRHGCLLAHPLLRTVSHTTARRTVV
jgi:hypothetical protein